MSAPGGHPRHRPGRRARRRASGRRHRSRVARSPRSPSWLRTGSQPDRAIVESALAAGSPGTWTVVWTGGGGFAALGGIEAIALDASLDGRPPLALKLAADERRRRGDAPRRVRVLLADGADAPDTGRWSESLHVPVDGRRQVGAGGDRRRGGRVPESPPRRGRRHVDAAPDRAARFRPAAILAVGILAVHGVLTVADWSRLAYEARGLRGDMEAAFRKAFPEAKAVVDPALQMRRNVADLRRAAGEPDADRLRADAREARAGARGGGAAAAVAATTSAARSSSICRSAPDEHARTSSRAGCGCPACGCASSASRPARGGPVATVRVAPESRR